MTDVVFLTNRKRADPASDPASYSAEPGPRLVTGIAQVGGANLKKRLSGSITAISATAEGGLHADAAARIAQAKHVLFFVHGFANSFPDAITRAAFVRDWLAIEPGPARSALVVAFSWPSPGQVIGFDQVMPSLSTDQLDEVAEAGAVLPGADAYFADKARARASGMAFLSALDLVRGAMGAPRAGRKFFLMAHSMGNELLAHALDQPPAPDLPIFDETFLVAADAEAARQPPVPSWLRSADVTSGRAHIYFSTADSVLRISHIVNGAERLGFLGRAGMEQAHSPGFRFVDCTATLDDDRSPTEGNAGHWYYRRVPSVRRDIAAAMAGQGPAFGLTVIPSANPAPPTPPDGPGA